MNENKHDAIALEDVNGVAGDGKEETVIGVVTDCLSLNIRKVPSKTANIVGTVTALSELKIDEDESTDDWFAVCTASGVSGFCMKKFVAVRR